MKAVLKNGVIYPREPIPPNWREGTELEVKEIALLSARHNGNRPKRDSASWPPGFIESTFGSIQDESFIRHSRASATGDKK